MRKISPFLWFDNRAEEAANFYTSVFANSRITDMTRYGEGSPGTPGRVMSVTFELEGEEFMALNGGPMFQFTPAISLFVKCESQQEVDELWSKLCADGGEAQQCGWLKDRFGLSWQIVPIKLRDMLRDPDRAKSKRVMDALLKMVKLDLPALERAYRGE
ncbi:VOC family protein [Paraburkholderia phosphatilytica]|uniref:VOC family protein n=1 Tax=Paraburkholderia phosphatilytica TaxID=2282883 RepID=UPI000E550D7D|nr:VOC family protein [Paraburkholderia phosphatilytica]